MAFLSLEWHIGTHGKHLMDNLIIEYNSLLSSSSILGVAFGSLMGGPLIAKFGRK